MNQDVLDLAFLLWEHRYTIAHCNWLSIQGVKTWTLTFSFYTRPLLSLFNTYLHFGHSLKSCGVGHLNLQYSLGSSQICHWHHVDQTWGRLHVKVTTAAHNAVGQPAAVTHVRIGSLKSHTVTVSWLCRYVLMDVHSALFSATLCVRKITLNNIRIIKNTDASYECLAIKLWIYQVLWDDLICGGCTWITKFCQNFELSLW